MSIGNTLILLWLAFPWAASLHAALPNINWPLQQKDELHYCWSKVEKQRFDQSATLPNLKQVHLTCTPITWSESSVYNLYLTIGNTQTDTAYLRFSNTNLTRVQQIWHIAYQRNRSYKNSKESWEKQGQRKLAKWPEGSSYLFVIPPQKKDTFIVQIQVLESRKSEKNLFRLENILAIQANKRELFLCHVMNKGISLGIYCLIFSIGFFRILFVQKDSVYFYFAGFAFFFALLVWRRLIQQYQYFDFSAGLFALASFRASLVLCSIICYQNFFKHIIPKSLVPQWLYWYIDSSNLFFSALIFLQLVSWLTDRQFYFTQLTHVIISIGPLMWLFFLFYLNQKNRDPIIKLLYWGTVSISAGILLTQILEFFLGESEFLSKQEMLQQWGSFVQLLTFAAAISIKHRQSYEDKQIAVQAYTDSLQTMRKKTADYELQLTQQQQEQIEQLKIEEELRFAQKTAYLQAKYNRELAEIELRALREQVKPHFIANAVSSICGLVSREQMQEAQQYLIELNDFLLLIHRYAEHPFIQLDHEFALLKLYLNLEVMRFTSRFKVVYEFDPALNPSEVNVPPLLLQLFAENAIKHAFLVDKPEQILLVSFYRDKASSNLVIAIEDNGIGRKAAAQVAKIEKSGMGTQIAQERIELFNKLDRGKISTRYIDLFHEAQARGFRVEIIFSPN